MVSTVQLINQTSDLVVGAGVAASIGFFGAHVFQHIIKLNPMSAAVFFALASVASKFLNPIIDKYFNGNESAVIAGAFVKVCVIGGLSASAATLLGYAVSFSTASALLLTVLAVYVIKDVGIGLAKATCG